MTARRIHLTPPITFDGLSCRNCGEPLFAAAKVVHDDSEPGWFVFQHGDGAESCRSSTRAEPSEYGADYTTLERLFTAQLADGGTSARSVQHVRVDAALERMFNAAQARKEFAAAGNVAAASEAMNAIRGIVAELADHDARSLALRLFLRTMTADA